MIIINLDRSVSVIGDPSVGPYDGGDDTLVGVQNDSAQSVDAITVRGAGSGLGLLDGDGICTFGLVGCPYGPTSYEGPNTRLVIDPTLPDEAEVDFDPPLGLPSGGRAYFSLEGALTSAAITVRQGHLGGGYTALGDSYSAGDGAGSYDINSGGCKRSSQAYGPQLSFDRSLGTFTFAACSGAITDDIFSPNNEGKPEPAQIDALASDTRTVTLTMGGNDVGFVDIASQCVFARLAFGRVHGDPGCGTRPALTKLVNRRLRALDGAVFPRNAPTTPKGKTIHSILSVIQAIHNKAPDAKIYIAGYPRLFGSFQGECGIGTIHWGPLTGAVKVISPDAAWMNQVVDNLDAAIMENQQIAALQGIEAYYVNPNPTFAGHRLCDKLDTWINPIEGTLHPNQDPLLTFKEPTAVHPSATGQKSGYEAAFLSVIP